MNSTAMLAMFRSDVRDEAVPFLWSDTEVFGYVNDAQNMFCRLHGGIADATSAVARVVVTAGNAFAPVSPLILKIREARRAADWREVDIVNFEDLNSHSSQAYRMDATLGQVDAMVVGMEANTVRLVRVPSEAQIIQLTVYRLPLAPITAVAQSLEIDEQHHRHLLLWAKHLAHQKQDAETYDKGRSEAFKSEFYAYCDMAKAERERREHKYRTIAYGGY